jgi:hypothetical protein
LWMFCELSIPYCTLSNCGAAVNYFDNRPVDEYKLL